MRTTVRLVNTSFTVEKKPEDIIVQLEKTGSTFKRFVDTDSITHWVNKNHVVELMPQ